MYLDKRENTCNLQLELSRLELGHEKSFSSNMNKQEARWLLQKSMERERDYSHVLETKTALGAEAKVTGEADISAKAALSDRFLGHDPITTPKKKKKKRRTLLLFVLAVEGLFSF